VIGSDPARDNAIQQLLETSVVQAVAHGLAQLPWLAATPRDRGSAFSPDLYCFQQ
jgi:hypothetical protein